MNPHNHVYEKNSAHPDPMHTMQLGTKYRTIVNRRLTVEFDNLAWPTSAVCFGPPCGTLMLRVFGFAGA